MLSHIIRLFVYEHLDNVFDGDNKIYADCPHCGKGNKHWDINTNTGLHKCFKCDYHGNFPQLVKKITGYYQPLDKLERQYESELTLEKLSKIFTKPVELEVVRTDWKENTCEISADGRLPKLARKYLVNRNTAVEFAEKLNFRVAISGKYQNRLIIPIIEKDEVQNFVARKFRGSGKRYTGPSLKDGFIKKSDLVYNLNTLKYNSHIVIVEGIFDCIALMDYFPTVALLGKSISITQIEKLLEKARYITVLMDGGFEAASKKIAERFLGLVDVDIAIMNSGDPGDSPELAKQAIIKSKNYFELGG